MSGVVLLRSRQGEPSLRLRSGLPVSIIARRSCSAPQLRQRNGSNRSVQIANPQTALAPGVQVTSSSAGTPEDLLTVGGEARAVGGSPAMLSFVDFVEKFLQRLQRILVSAAQGRVDSRDDIRRDEGIVGSRLAGIKQRSHPFL